MSYDIRKYSSENLLNELRQFYKDNKRVPTARDFYPKLGHTDCRLYRAKFGSWNKALELAGLEINKEYLNVSNEEMINFLIKYYRETGKIPTKSQFNGGDSEYPHHNNYLHRFGSWTNALKIAGLDVDNLVKNNQINIDSCESYKGRLFELTILKSFKNNGAVDCSSKNYQSPFDGICPKGYRYDAKSSKLQLISKYAKGWRFSIQNKNKELTQYYIFGAFDEHFKKLMFVWLVPNDFLRGRYAIVIMYNKTSRMEKYNIINKCNIDIFKEKEIIINNDITNKTIEVNFKKTQTKTLSEYYQEVKI